MSVVDMEIRYLKASSHGAILSECDCVFLIGCVGVYETVHVVQLWCRSQTCVSNVTHGMGFIPILCDGDVQFQYVSIQITVTPCEQFHKIACKQTQSYEQSQSYRLSDFSESRCS